MKNGGLFKTPASSRIRPLVFRQLVLETADSQDIYKTYSKKDKGMLRNIDDSTRIDSNRLVFRRLVLETDDSQIQQEDGLVFRRLILETVDSQGT